MGHVIALLCLYTAVKHQSQVRQVKDGQAAEGQVSDPDVGVVVFVRVGAVFPTGLSLQTSIKDP